MSGEILNNTGSVVNIDNFLLNFTGSVEPSKDLPLLYNQDGVTYIDVDTFSYLIMLILLGVILFRTLVLVITWCFKLGFFIYGGAKIGEK